MANSPSSNKFDIHTSLTSTSTLPNKNFEIKIYIRLALELHYPSYRWILQHHDSTLTFLFTHKRLIATEIERNPSHRGISTIVTILNVSTIFIIPDILEESMQDVPRPIPATEEAIQKLEKVTFQDCLESTSECTVCCEEFHQNDHVNQIVRMPCAHVYHQQCIQKWLKLSHLCPLCRYKMPCSEN
ncbi:hypothetical protein Patl1_07904 [Pistacia atlantica]|uniref:Uncharacterized protein n=1 Tax=Pistacia atlantica TaxID=434234 RepID=A0ACC1AKE7_9ROSI|nr:hypothetical protein Patl1_07904 [Pistacia atlantica]